MNINPCLTLNCFVHSRWFVNSPLVNTGLDGLRGSHGKIVFEFCVFADLVNSFTRTRSLVPHSLDSSWAQPMGDPGWRWD